jgi:hypothetical protein
LWNFAVWSRLYRMDQVRKEDCVLDEEHRDVVANDVKVAFICVKTRCKTMDVSNRICTTTRTSDRGEAYEGRCLFARRSEEGRRCDI